MDPIPAASDRPPILPQESGIPSVHSAILSENPESLSRDPAGMIFQTPTSYHDPALPCTAIVPPVVESPVVKQLPDAPQTQEIRVSEDKGCSHLTPSAGRKPHHPPAPETRVSMQNKSSHANRISSQNKSVQWVRVSSQSQSAYKTRDTSQHQAAQESRVSGHSVKLGSKECVGLPSSSTEVLQHEAEQETRVAGQSVKHGSKECAALPPSSTEVLQHEAEQQETRVSGHSVKHGLKECVGLPSSSTEALQHEAPQETRVSGHLVKHGSKECVGLPSSSTEALQHEAAQETRVSDHSVKHGSNECVGLLPSAREAPEHEAVGPPSPSKAYHQAVGLPSSSKGPQYQVVEEHYTSSNVHQAAEESQIFSGVAEDAQTSEPQRSLSRASSLNAKAREFVPKSAPASGTAPAMSPPAMQPPPLMIPLGSSPGILSMFPPSPIPSTQLGGFPPPMAGPPPPPIPVSLMGPMPLLGPPHPGLLNVQIPGPPPPPAIPPPTFMMHSSSLNVPVHPHSGPSLANQSVGTNVEAVQDQHQPHDLDPVSAQAVTSKPILTEDLKAKIVKQVEYYFSDANLPTDYHLMKFVKKDPEGFVPIAVVANFRKIKNLLKNYALVAVALRSSKELVVSEDGKKVRRLHPLPHVDLEEIQSRTVVAENLPADHSIESMERLFGSVGNVKMVRICEPEAANGANQASAKFVKADMVVSNKLHALIEYESVEQAERAVSMLTDQRNWRTGLHVRLLLRRTFQNKHGHQPPIGSKAPKVSEGGDGSGGEEDAVPSASDSVPEKIEEESHAIERSDELVGNDNVHFEKDGSSKRGRGRGRGRSRGRQFHPNGGRSHPVGTPPQASSLPNAETKPPPGPRMPDGTRGFTIGRGKALSINSV